MKGIELEIQVKQMELEITRRQTLQRKWILKTLNVEKTFIFIFLIQKYDNIEDPAVMYFRECFAYVLSQNIGNKSKNKQMGPN